MDPIGVALGAVLVVMTAWFWPHCAQPALASQRDSVRAQRVVLAVTVLSITAYSTGVITDIAQIAVPGLWSATGVIGAAWIVVVGLGYLENYRTLLRITRTRLQRG